MIRNGKQPEGEYRGGFRIRAASLLFILWLTLFCGERLTAQPFVRVVNPFAVRESSGEQLQNPFTGGLDLTRIGLLDLDGDSHPDLFTLNLGERLRRYHNDGLFPFRLDSSSFWETVPIRSWFRFADLDGDGNVDLFTSGERSELMILQNTGTTLNPEFSPIDTLRQSGGQVMYTEQQTVPTFVDIDDDGDLDLFSGNIDGSITYYENVGNRTSPSLTFRTGRFEGIIVIAPAQSLKEKMPSIQKTALHGASVIDFVDLDNDADLDMLFGDFFTKRLLHFENRGTRVKPDFDSIWVDTAFEPNGDRVQSQGFNQAVSGDLDGDGDIDIVVSSLLASAGARPVELFINQGNVESPVMKRSPVNLTNEIDVGRQAAPALLHDNERYGLLVGSEDGSVTWYDVTEEGGKTSWKLSRRYILSGVTQSAPAAGDIDGDGRAEIVIGKADAVDGSTLRLYHFQGNELVRVPWQLDTSANVVRKNASPALVDIDNDGDLDLFVGANNGRLYLFRNIGSPTAPLFEGGPAPPPFDQIDLDQDSAPRFGDLDGDGDLDLMIGSRAVDAGGYDTVLFRINDGGTFREDSAWPPMPVTYIPVPLAAQFAEGRFLFMGTKAGGLIAFYDTTSGSSSVNDQELIEEGRIDVTPGVILGDGTLTVRWRDVRSQTVVKGEDALFILADVTGREVARTALKGTEGTVSLPLTALPSGTYLWRVPGIAGGAIHVHR